MGNIVERTIALSKTDTLYITFTNGKLSRAVFYIDNEQVFLGRTEEEIYKHFSTLREYLPVIEKALKPPVFEDED